MSSIAIIPARGGSKRIPRKNIKYFSGKPIIAYSIETALKSDLFDEVMVSTDDDEIAMISEKTGARIPFMRSPENADDYAGLADVIVEVLEEYKKRDQTFESFCCILPTAPLLLQDDLVSAKRILDLHKYKTVFPVVRYSYPIQRCLRVSNSKTEMIWPENYSARSQDLDARYHDCGLFYWGNTESLLSSKALFTDHSGSVEIPELRVQDVDTFDDWAICELKYRLLNE